MKCATREEKSLYTLAYEGDENKMTTRPTHLNKDRVLGLLDEARTRIEYYQRENEEHPKKVYLPGSVDQVALRLLEDQEGFVAVGVHFRGNNVNLHGRVGHLHPSGVMYVEPITVTYVLKDCRGTTVARFIDSICDVVSGRALNGNPDVRAIMMDGAVASAKKTKGYVAGYT